jgi:quercetin dioxygenase-like cupin family protein/predicted ester cyclase
LDRAGKEGAMPRSMLLPASVILSVLTALTCLGVAGALQAPTSLTRATPATAASRRAVVRFYDAVNAAIATGDLTLFDAIVAPDFVDREAVPSFGTDQAGLAAYLRALHATVPTASVTAETIVAEDDRVMARVIVGVADRSTSLGLPFPTGGFAWGTVDVFRVDDNQIAERWSDSDGLSLLMSLGRASLMAGELPARPVVSFDRLSLGPGGRLETRSDGGIWLIQVETGPLTVSIGSDAPTPALVSTAGGSSEATREVSPGSDLTLAAGDVLVLPPSTRYELRGAGDEPTRALVINLDQAAPLVGRSDPAYPETSPSETAVAIDRQRLAGGTSAVLPPGRVTVAVGRTTFAPGAGIPAHQTVGATLVYVEAGSLHLRTEAGASWVTLGPNDASSDRAEASLVAGDGALVPPGATATLRNLGDEPLVALVVTIVPADEA